MKKFVELATGVTVAAAIVIGALRRPTTATVSPTGTSPRLRPPAAAPIPRPERTSPEGAPTLVTTAKSLLAAIKADRLPLMAAAAAFYAFLALVPAILAVVTVYGLVADPSQVAAQVAGLSAAVPTPVVEFLEHQLTSIAGADNSGLGIGLALSIAGLLWSTSKAAQVLLKAQNAVYGVEEGRGFAKQRLVAIAVTLGALILVVAVLLASALVPQLASDLSDSVRSLVTVGQWFGLGLITAGALAALYRWGPNRSTAERRFVLTGALVATVMWLGSSLGLAFYVSQFGSYNETYGTLGSIIVVQTWLFVSALAVLAGAELDAVLTEETVRTD